MSKADGWTTFQRGGSVSQPSPSSSPGSSFSWNTFDPLQKRPCSQTGWPTHWSVPASLHWMGSCSFPIAIAIHCIIKSKSRRLFKPRLCLLWNRAFNTTLSRMLKRTNVKQGKQRDCYCFCFCQYCDCGLGYFCLRGYLKNSNECNWN